jgi:hypothetical protein
MTPALEAAQQGCGAPMQATVAATNPLQTATAAATPNSRGSPWSAEEHLAFIQGLAALGKGKWKEISRTFVVT